MKQYEAPDFSVCKINLKEAFSTGTYVCDGRFVDTYGQGCHGNSAYFMLLDGRNLGYACYTQYDVIPGI